jgi:outer membrane protein assembly factor BamB
VHITDTHLTATGNIQPLRDLVQELNAMQPPPAFVVDTGDVTEAGRPEEFKRFLEGTQGLAMPFYCAPGNHDTRWGPLGKEAFEKSIGKLYQSFDRGGVHFVILDSTVLLQHWGHFDTAQLKWLQNDLKKLKKDTPVFFFFHHWVGREREMVDNADAFLRIIAPYNVKAMFVGHGHADIQWKVNGIPCFMARGLYQGSYNLVEVGPDDFKVYRVRKEAQARGRGPALVQTITRKAGPERKVEFLWGDPNIPLLARRRPLAELQVNGRADDDRVKAEYVIDGGTAKPMERDVRDKKSVSFMAEFETKDLALGAHVLRVILTDPNGDVYQRDEPFVVERLTGQPKRAWETPFRAGDTIQSTPALVGDTLYVSCFDGKLYALDAASGKQRWAASTKGALFSSPVVADGLVYVGSMDHGFYAFDAKSGRQRWRFDAGTPLFAAAGVQDGVVCFGANEKIFGVDARTGAKLWEQPAEGFFQSKAAAADGVFYLGSWGNTLYALDAKTGAPRWTAKMGRAGGGTGALSFYYSPAITSPTVAEGRVYVCTNDGLLHAVDTATGKDVWAVRAPQGGDTFGYSSPLYAGGRIYLGGLGKRGDVYALNAKTGELIWRCATGNENYDSSPAIAGGLIAIGSVPGKVSWVEVETGKLVHQYGLDPGYCFSSPVMTEKVTYIPSMNNHVYAISVPK